MTTRQKALFFLYAGMVLLLGTVGGIEHSPDLLTGDGAYQQDCRSLVAIAVQEAEEHEQNGLEAYESLAVSAIARARGR